MIANTNDSSDFSDRRRLLALRKLVDELLGQIREVSAHPEWSDEERMRAEADLERIMANVREETLRDRAKKP